MQVSTHELQARRMADEAHDTLEWLELFGPAYGLPDELVDELRSRLQRIEQLAARH